MIQFEWTLDTIWNETMENVAKSDVHKLMFKKVGLDAKGSQELSDLSQLDLRIMRPEPKCGQPK